MRSLKPIVLILACLGLGAVVAFRDAPGKGPGPAAPRAAATGSAPVLENGASGPKPPDSSTADDTGTRPAAKHDLRVIGEFLATRLEGRPSSWTGDNAWLRRTLRQCPGGVEDLVAWFVRRGQQGREMRRLGYILIAFALSHEPWKAERDSVRRLAVGFLAGREEPPLSVDGWLAAAPLSGWAIPETSREDVERTGRGLARSHPPSQTRILQALADLGIRSTTLRSEVVRALKSQLEAQSLDTLDAWVARPSLVELLVTGASEVPENLILDLELCSNTGAQALGFHLHVVTTSDPATVERVLNALTEWRLDSPHHERLVAAVMQHRPHDVADDLPRMLERPGAFSSPLADHMTPGIQRWRPLTRVARALKEGKLVWDPRTRLIRVQE